MARGDRVAATARSVAIVADLADRYGDAVPPLALDVTDGSRAGEAHRRSERLDVEVNTAGYA